MPRPNKRVLEWARQDAQRKMADKLNEEGAKEHSFFWLKANQAAVRILHEAQLPTETNRYLGALIATEIARYYKTGLKDGGPKQ